MQTFWLDVVDGPLHGAKYYDGEYPVDNRIVNLGSFKDGFYRIWNGRVIWQETN